MTLRLELASLLAGFDVERVRRERDEAIDLLDDLRFGAPCLPDDHLNYYDERNTFARQVDRFLARLPVGAVDSARKRLAKGGA
jgi:hypothetical protein